MLQIPAKVTIGDCEKLLAQIPNCGPVAVCALDISHNRYGGEVALLQLLATWAQAFPRATLEIRDTGGGDQTQEFVRTLHGLAAISLAHRVLLEFDHSDFTDVAASLADVQLQKIWRED